MIKKYLILVVSILSFSASAQLYEAGVVVGGSNYIGDIGSERYIWPNDFAFGGIFRYNHNPRVTYRAKVMYFSISDNDADSDNAGRQQRGYSFQNNIFEVSAGLEFSWWDYSLFSDDYRQTPYMFFDIAAINYKTVDGQNTNGDFTYKNKTSVAVPFGLGYKAAVADNLVLSAEVGFRLTFSDDLDYNNEDYPELDFGNPNSNDWYVFTGISLTYSFGRLPCDSTRRL